MADPAIPADKRCEGIILAGENKGKQCPAPPTKDGHCLKHQNQILHKALLKEGKKPCNNFFRGCRTILAPDDKFTTCKECRDKKSADAGKVNDCQKVKCPYFRPVFDFSGTPSYDTKQSPTSGGGSKVY